MITIIIDGIVEMWGARIRPRASRIDCGILIFPLTLDWIVVDADKVGV